ATGRDDLSGARLRAPRQLDSSDSAPLAAGVERGGRDAIDKRRAPREHRHLDGPHAEVGSDQGRIHRRRHGQSHAPAGHAGALEYLTVSTPNSQLPTPKDDLFEETRVGSWELEVGN